MNIKTLLLCLSLTVAFNANAQINLLDFKNSNTKRLSSIEKTLRSSKLDSKSNSSTNPNVKQKTFYTAKNLELENNIALDHQQKSIPIQNQVSLENIQGTNNKSPLLIQHKNLPYLTNDDTTDYFIKVSNNSMSLSGNTGLEETKNNHYTNDSQSANSCWHAAANYHKVDVVLLYAIAWVESRFKPNAENRNTNGSIDVGLMQINSIWLPTLKKHGITQSMLYDGCTSVFIGAWILSNNFNRYGYSWKAIGAYNSATPSKSYAYAKKVYAAHAALIKQFANQNQANSGNSTKN